MPTLEPRKVLWQLGTGSPGLNVFSICSCHKYLIPPSAKALCCLYSLGHSKWVDCFPLCVFLLSVHLLKNAVNVHFTHIGVRWIFFFSWINTFCPDSTFLPELSQRHCYSHSHLLTGWVGKFCLIIIHWEGIEFPKNYGVSKAWVQS